MAVDAPKPPTLRRSCQACARGKRRCDQRLPRCSRCLTRRIDCEYVNMPLMVTSSSDSGVSKAGQTFQPTRKAPSTRPPSIRPALPLEIAKGYPPTIIAFLVTGMQSYPCAFAQNLKTHFIHPDLWPSRSTPPSPIREIHTLCKLHAQPTRTSSTLLPLLRQKSSSFLRQINHSISFEEMLAIAQALLLAQCMLILAEDPSAPSYSEAISTMLFNLGQKLWQQAPTQLPRSLSPRKAWLFAESVRRTIIVGFILRSVYSLKKRNYSVRTPFVDSLPFDVRTALWDEDGDTDGWSVGGAEPLDSMVSLHQYSSMMERGMVHGISDFGGLILAACKGRAIDGVPYPPANGYRY
ncbi:hypothetical protein BO70DRAFT_422416 [Aspergillus heteromorphus CBS 117.55]|uniref:Zn(2)-C6 fungal-type domain-containing protein n=1 Tax=Aspergillus heteromorphus CBS 117.55 TaxID=1448321 RepID=A0A317WND1_9EURO|nr:uncharacterized protein BO70DRAFT_422416 [Aspergillus heteromorphus CBS 117.55]PWY86762.1 hypothetical protein BO70DRAFT_422416 [Aspergillus heteromorphus CBS 117.55]